MSEEDSRRRGATRSGASGSGTVTVIGIPPEDVYARAKLLGRNRVQRPGRAILTESLIGGLYVTFSGLGALTLVAILLPVTTYELAWAFGALLYPIGFLFVIFGESELFTENFLTPIMAAREDRASWRGALRLWSLTLVGNLVGVVLMAAVWAAPGLGLLPEHVRAAFAGHAGSVLAREWPVVFTRAVFGGMLINFVTWLVLVSRAHVTQAVFVVIPTFLLMFLQLEHSMVGSFEILVGVFGGSASLSAYVLKWLPWALLGNAVGGALFVGGLYTLREAMEAPRE